MLFKHMLHTKPFISIKYVVDINLYVLWKLFIIIMHAGDLLV